MNAKHIKLLFVISILPAFFCCSNLKDFEKIKPGSVRIKTITGMLVGNTEQFVPEIFPENAANRDVRWSSSDESIVKIDQTGLATAVTAGTSTVTVQTVEGNCTSSCTVIVSATPVAVTGISLNKNTAIITCNRSETLIAALTPVNATNQKISWRSVDNSIARVDANGRISGSKTGSTGIVAFSEDGNFVDDCIVTVNPDAVLNVGYAYQFTSTIIPPGAAVTWTSSDNTVVTVDSTGLVTANSEGSVVLKATAENGGAQTWQCRVSAAAPYTYTTSGSAITITKYNGSDSDIIIPVSIQGVQVTAIGYMAFTQCSGLVSISMPESITAIGDMAFANCTGLVSMSIPAAVTTIGFGAFMGCSGITGFSIPAGVTILKNFVFGGCTGLTGISIPSTVTTIEMNAFGNCTGLTTISIPSSITTLSPNAFDGCKRLSAFEVDPASSIFSSIEGVLFNKTGLTIVKYPEGKTGSYTIPSSVTTIESSAFSGCTGLTGISIPSGVTTIGGSAFRGCTGLTEISIPSGVTVIGGGAFDGCTGLKNITIPSGVTSIDGMTFNGCTGLSELTIPPGITTLGMGAFMGCAGLTSISIPAGVTTIDMSVFSGCTGLKNISIPSGVTTIGMGAFGGCSGLTSISIPSTVTSISMFAFGGCTGLTSISIPSGVTKLDWSAFEGCTGLTSISISAAVTVINSKAFYGCTGITAMEVDPANVNFKSIDGVLYNKTGLELIMYPAGKTGPFAIPGTVTSVREYAFAQCKKLSTLSIPASVTTIGNYVFEGSALTAFDVNAASTNFQSIDGVLYNKTGPSLVAYPGSRTGSFTIPGTVKTIKEKAFYGCTGLTGITIPSSVTTIEGYAFEGCTGLSAVIIPSSVTTIMSMVFNNCTALKSVREEAVIPPLVYMQVFEKTHPDLKIYVPAGSITAYKTAGTTNWWYYKDRMFGY